MHNASLPNIFLASKSFSQYSLADIFSPCIVPHKAMQFSLCPISHPHPLTPSPPHARIRAHTRIITANYFFAVTSVTRQDILGGKSYPITIAKEHKAERRIKRKTRRGGERKVQNTPLPKSKNRVENRVEKKEGQKKGKPSKAFSSSVLCATVCCDNR